jgi:hypothetical protein
MVVAAIVAVGCGRRPSEKPGGPTGARPRRIYVELDGAPCVVAVVSPDPAGANPGDAIHWHYKNKCRPKKKERIAPMAAPFSGSCTNDTEVGEPGSANGNEADSGPCQVDKNAADGHYKYAVDGDVAKDPELDIPPPVTGSPTPTPAPTPTP